MDELLGQFITEARELVQQVSDDLLVLEKSPADRIRLESAFRAIHTLKGSVGLFDFGPVHDVLHQTETLLEAARGRSIDIDAGLVDVLMAIVDWVDRCVENIARAGRPAHALTEQSAALLALLHSGGSSPSVAPVSAIVSETPPDWATLLLAEAGLQTTRQTQVTAIRYEPHPECFFNGDDPLTLIAQLPELLHLKISPRDPWPDRAVFDPFRCNLRIEAIASADRSQIDRIFRLIPDQVGFVTFAATQGTGVDLKPEPENHLPETLRTTVRVDTDRIDALVDIASELITAKNALLPLASEALRDTGNERLAQRIMASHQEIERLVGSLHAAVTRVRMIPLEHTFRRFPRLVRETATRLGKSVDLVVEGETVEADREIVEELFEPLLHLLRNSLDHGIETSSDRVAAGKSARGMLNLRAVQRGDQIDVSLSDDGRGLDPDRIRATAVSRGMITAIDAAALSDASALQMIFGAGFSTAKSVSDISGRGVGLDAVQNVIRRLGGGVELKSTPGQGAAFILHLPITFAMSRLMVVEVGGERYGVPIEKVVEVLRVPANDVTAIRARQAFVLRDRTIPLLNLAKLLHLEGTPSDDSDCRVVVVHVGGEPVGIVVDAIAERADTLMRPLSGLLRDLPGIAGTTTLGDGRVLLVIDVEDLIR